MEYKTQNYVGWDEYIKNHPEISDIDAAKKIQSYEDQVFSLMMRLFR